MDGILFFNTVKVFFFFTLTLKNGASYQIFIFDVLK